MIDIVQFLGARYAEEWGAARDRELLARLDESRGTRDVDAKRRLIQIVLDYEATIDGEWGCRHSPGEIAAGACPGAPAGIEAFRVMAAPYSDHPDYDPEWALEPTEA